MNGSGTRARLSLRQELQEIRTIAETQEDILDAMKDAGEPDDALPIARLRELARLARGKLQDIDSRLTELESQVRAAIKDLRERVSALEGRQP